MLFEGLSPKRKVSYSLIYYDENWQECKNLARMYLSREEMVRAVDAWASNSDTFGAGHKVQWNSRTVPVFMSVEVYYEQA